MEGAVIEELETMLPTVENEKVELLLKTILHMTKYVITNYSRLCMRSLFEEKQSPRVTGGTPYGLMCLDCGVKTQFPSVLLGLRARIKYIL